MLPTTNRLYTRHSTAGQLFNQLRQRTRLTNLAVSLLTLSLCLSLLLNTSYILSSRPTRVASGWEDLLSDDRISSGIPLSIESTVERDPKYSTLDHMIMVPGHAIWIGNDPGRAGDDDQWILENMQKGGSVRTYRKHIERGIELLKSDTNSLLVFSGGATRSPPSPPLPESLSYLSLAHSLNLLPSTPIPNALPLNLRVATEEYALDSYQNLLFALARFKEVTSQYPSRVTVVGYGMKRARFDHLHRAAIAYPRDNFTYVGIDDEGDVTPHYAGELKYGFLPFVSSPSGCHPPLSMKRLLRNPYSRYHPYHTSCPELAKLFEWCLPPDPAQDVQLGEVTVRQFTGQLPWRVTSTKFDRERD